MDYEITVDEINADSGVVDRGMSSAGGIRGIRFTLFDPTTAVTGFDMIEPLARRVNDLGWHVQLHLAGDQIAQHETLLMRIVAPIVFDHMGRLPQPQGLNHPAFGVIQTLRLRQRLLVDNPAELYGFPTASITPAWPAKA